MKLLRSSSSSSSSSSARSSQLTVPTFALPALNWHEWRKLWPPFRNPGSPSVVVAAGISALVSAVSSVACLIQLISMRILRAVLCAPTDMLQDLAGYAGLSTATERAEKAVPMLTIATKNSIVLLALLTVVPMTIWLQITHALQELAHVGSCIAQEEGMRNRLDAADRTGALRRSLYDPASNRSSRSFNSGKSSSSRQSGAGIYVDTIFKIASAALSGDDSVIPHSRQQDQSQSVPVPEERANSFISKRNDFPIQSSPQAESFVGTKDLDPAAFGVHLVSVTATSPARTTILKVNKPVKLECSVVQQ